MVAWVLGKCSNNNFDFRRLTLRHLLAIEEHEERIFGIGGIGEEIFHLQGLCLMPDIVFHIELNVLGL